MPVFEDIEIETVNRCNGRCTFCPVNAAEPQRKYAKMDEELFDNIITQLQELDYRGRVFLSSNNEPFLDKRILDFCKKAREKLPNADIQMYTNGILLTEEKLENAMKYLNYLVIDCYGDGWHLNSKMKQLKQYSKTKNWKGKVFFSIRKGDEVLSSRGGFAPNKRIDSGIDAGCSRPFKQMVIRPDGKISLCCNDALGQVTLGDAGKERLINIWNSPKYRLIRKSLIRNRRRAIRLCSKCDVLA